MKALVVLTFELPAPESIVAVLKALNPPGVPCFAGEARIVLEPEASAVTDWLDGSAS